MNYQDILQELLITMSSNHKGCGKQTLLATAGTVVSLTVPNEASYAILKAETDDTEGSTDYQRLIRWWIGTGPTAGEGIPMGHLDSWSVGERDNLIKLRILGIDENSTPKVQIQYYY